MPGVAVLASSSQSTAPALALLCAHVLECSLKAYLSKVLQGLVRGGVVHSQRGIGGGMTLLKSPEDLTLLEVVNAVDPVERIRELTGGFGADVCIEAVGNPAVLEQAFYARDLAGTVVQVGVPSPDMAFPAMPMIDFFGRGGALKPSWYGDCLPSRDFPALIDLALQGKFPLERFVSETIPLDGVEEAFARMERGEVLRSVVVFE